MKATILEVKLDLLDQQKLLLPGNGVSVLSVGQQNGELVMWVETIDKENEPQSVPQTEITVHIVGTGQERGDTFGSSYVGTVQMSEAFGGRVWHVYVFAAALR